MPDMTLFLDSCPNGSTPISEVLVGVMNENANLDIIGIPPVMIPSPADEDEIFRSTLESFQIEYPWLNKQVVFFDSKESMAQELASRGYPPLQSGCFSADQIYCLRAHIPENPEEASDLFAHELAHQLQMVNGGKKKLSELEGLNCRYAQVDEMGNPVTTDTCTAMTEFGAELTGGNAGGYYFGEDNLPAEEYLSYIYSDLDSKGCVANLTPEDFAEGFSSLETDAIQAVNQAFLDCNLTAASYFKDYGNEYNASNNIIEENILRRISLKLSEGIIALGSNVISKSQIFREQGISSSVYAENEIKSIDKSGVYRLEEEGLGIELSTRRIVKTTVTDESIQRGQIKTFWDKNRDGFKQDDEPYIDSSNQPFKINIEEEAFEYTFRKGLNLVSFPFIPEEFNTASELWNYLHGNFVDVKDIAKYDSGKFIIYSRTRSGEFSGDDFNLIPGEGYIIFTPESQGVVVFRGNNIQDSVLLKMGVGWNLIGIVSDKELTSKSFLRSCRDVDIFCDVLSEYKNGRYNNSVLDEEELFYGEDFVIDRKSGYFVRVGQNSSASEFSP